MGTAVFDRVKLAKLLEDLAMLSGMNNVYKDQQELNLTNTEYRILRLLLSCPRQTFSAQNIYESVWNEPYFPGANNTIMVFIRKLREKIEENPKNPKILVTVWGKGYRIE